MPELTFYAWGFMEINGRKIGPDQPPYLIAEMSNNHLGSLDRAKQIIRAAREAGADAVKIQTYDPEALTIDSSARDFIIQSPLWQGQTYFDLYSRIGLPLEHTSALFECARDEGITLFSSPFDGKTIDLLMALDCPAYKIASFEAVDPEFLKQVAKTGKPVFMSTGVSTLADIEKAMAVLEENGARDILLFHCTSEYPAALESCNIRALKHLKQFTSLVGLSDHCLDDSAALASIALGGCAVEKHFTLSRADKGPDAAFSLEPDEFRQLKQRCDTLWKTLGTDTVLHQDQRPGREHARSLYIVKAVKKGDTATPDNIRSIRPGYGLSPDMLDLVLGKRFKNDFNAGTALRQEYFS